VARAKTQRLPVVGAAELEYLLGVSQQRAFQLINHPSFPAPWVHLRAAKLWLMDDVETWADEHDRKLNALPAEWPPPRGAPIKAPAAKAAPVKRSGGARGATTKVDRTS
jgi:hypothetical protein